MSAYLPGSSLDIWEGETIQVVVFLGAEKGKLKVVTGEGREMRIADNRVANVGGHEADVRRELSALGREVKAEEAALCARAAEVDLTALWEVLCDDGGEYSLDDMAELALGAREGRNRGAVLRALVGDKLYFQRKRLVFAPRSRVDLDETLKRRAREAERVRERGEFLARARARLASPATDPAEAWPKGSERFLEALRDFAVNGAESERFKEAEGLLGEIGVRTGSGEPWVQAFETLVRFGFFSVDENLLVLKHRIRRGFSREALAEAERVAVMPVASGPDRRDLTGLTSFAVDDAETSEVDDAFSLESLDGGIVRLGVHIADPLPYLAFGGLLDLEARDRATTYYLPEERLLMLPPAISEGVASLVAGARRTALSFLVDLLSDGTVERWEVTPSWIRIERRVTYEEADVLIAAGGGAPRLEEPEDAPMSAGEEGTAGLFARAARLCRRILERRAEAGALILKGPDLDIKVQQARVRVRKFEPWTPAWVLVSETMILANRLAAEWLKERGIPAIYRRQTATDQKMLVPRVYDPAIASAARRNLKRTEISLTPGPHAGLGLPAYVQVTSPLRRYQDLAGHRQIQAALKGEKPPFDAEALWRVAASADEAEKVARETERGTREYWLYKYLEAEPHERVYEAVITRAEERRTLVELVDFAHVASLVPRPGHKPGRKIRVVLDAVNPRGGRLVMREVGG